MKWDLEYLQSLLQAAVNKRNAYIYTDIEEANAEITYFTTKGTWMTGILAGLQNNVVCLEKSLYEREYLRIGTPSYLRYIKKDGIIIKIEVYIEGSLSFLYLPLYEERKRYLFPFSLDGTPYPTYTVVTNIKENFVTEEYLVSNTQIIYEKYEKKNENTVLYSMINHIPSSRMPILSTKNASIALSHDLLCEMRRKLWNFLPKEK